MLIQKTSKIRNVVTKYNQSSLIILTSVFKRATLGLPSIVQNLRLNKIEIGQFLYIKYKLTGAKVHINRISAVIKFSAALGKIISATTKAVGKPAKIIYINKYGLCSSVSMYPSLFVKVRGLMNLVLLKIFNIKGIPSKVNQNKTGDQYEKTCVFFPNPETIEVIEHPKLIPNQKTKVQNRSLVSHFFCLSTKVELSFLALYDLVKSCIIYFSFYIGLRQLINIIITKLQFIAKLILKYFGGVIFLISANTTYAETREEILTTISQNEKKYNIPGGLLLAIAKIESNLEPLALNINGNSIFPKSKETALLAIKKALISNITNIDIGIAQINFKWHKNNFKTIESMILLENNLNYAAKLLAQLKKQHGTWHKAVRYYHSASSKHNQKYSRKVVLCWLEI